MATKPMSAAVPEAKSDPGNTIHPLYDYAKYVGEGFEEAPPIPIPWLKIIQGGEADYGKPESPIYKKPAGSILYEGNNTVDLVWTFLPCHMTRRWLQWKDRDPSSKAPMATFRDRPVGVVWVENEGLQTVEGYPVYETHTLYGLVPLTVTQFAPAAIAFSRTSLAISRDLLKILETPVAQPSIARKLTPPIFARFLQLSSKTQSNTKFTWFEWAVKVRDEFNAPSSFAFNEALAFRKRLKDYLSTLTLNDTHHMKVTGGPDDIPF